MKNFPLLFKFLIVFAAVSFFTACEEDPVDPPVDDTPPTINFVDEAGFLIFDATIAIGETFSVKVSGDQGTNPMNTLTIYEDNIQVNFDRMMIDGAPAGVNPKLLVGGNDVSFTFEIDIEPHAIGTATYAFEVVDKAGERAEVSLNITVEDPTTPLDSTLIGILLNAGGPPGTGGLDLDAGIGTGSDDAIAEIKDLGIDINLPNDMNWIQMITGVNGSVLKKVNTDNLPEGFNFDAVDNKESIRGAFDTGDDLTDNITGKITGGNLGDMYTVFNDTNARYYLIRLDEVNVVTTDNSDNYVISIKY